MKLKRINGFFCVMHFSGFIRPSERVLTIEVMGPGDWLPVPPSSSGSGR